MKAKLIQSLRECAYLLSILLFVTMALSAQQAQRTLLRAGHVIDVHTGNEAADETIIITGDKITAIAATASTPAQAGDKEVDLSGLTVLPGMIDAHTHLTMNTEFDPYAELTTTSMKEALNGVINAKTTLMAGFTTVRNVGSERLFRCHAARRDQCGAFSRAAHAGLRATFGDYWRPLR
jgi:imidazolonepropionase-like amidohydrolase